MATLVLSTAVPAAADAQQSTTAAKSFVFDSVTVVDVEHGKRLPGQRVVIAGNRIQTVGDAGAIKVPPGAQVVSAKGKYLIPGLWDMHVHAHKEKGDVQKFYLLSIAYGVTGLRDMGGMPVSFDTLAQWRHDVAAGRRVGPRVVAAGPLVDGPLPGDMPTTGLPVWLGPPWRLRPNTPAEGRRIVDSLKAAGADFVKVYSLLAPDVYFAIAAEARRVGIPFAGHLPFDGVTEMDASDSGQRSIEHVMQNPDPYSLGSTVCERPDSISVAECAATAARFVRNGSWWVPTVSVHLQLNGQEKMRERLRYWPKEAVAGGGVIVSDDGQVRTVSGDNDSTINPKVESSLQTVSRMRRAGMPLLAGTDIARGVIPATTVHNELELFVRAGLTPLEALQTATLNPAKYFYATDSLGTIASGKVADLVLLDADPLADITNTKTIRAVVANGRYFDRTSLDGLLAEAEVQGKSEP